MRSTTLQTIARLTFPGYKGNDVSIMCADEIGHHDDDTRVIWLVDLAQIEAAGPNIGTMGERLALPISSGVPILPSQSAQIVARPQMEFQCERFMISSAGTAGGAADWIVNDIRMGGRAQLSQSGDLPGDMFATNAIDAYVAFEANPGDMDIAVIVTYIGNNEVGVPFFGSMVGKQYKAKPEYVRVRSNARQPIPLGFALVAHALPAGSRRRDDSPITIYVPSIDQATIDVAVDAVLTSGAATDAVHKMIGNVMGKRHELVHATYVALVEQRANALAEEEARASLG